MTAAPSLEEQEAAFKRYAEAVRKVEKSLDFEDGRAAKDAWIAFLNLYLPDDRKMPEYRISGSNNIEIFPVHRSGL